MTTPDQKAENVTPAQLSKAKQFGLWVHNHWANIKATGRRLWQKWKDEPVKTTGYGVIAAVVAYFAAEGFVDSNVTNLITSLVTLGAGAPVVNAVSNQTKQNVQQAHLAGKVAGRNELMQAQLNDQLKRSQGK